jgi:UDP-glucuronate decarboxylase
MRVLLTGALENFELLIDKSGFTLFKHDAREPLEVDVDSVLNFAYPASPLRYQNDALRTIETNF